MKVVWLAVLLAFAAALAHAAEDMADTVSRYRREHGLSSVKTDPQLTAVAERQAKAMAASGIMDHSVAGSFASRISGVHAGMAAENIAAGTKTWDETFRMWQNSPGHNANLLQSRADSVGFAVARNDQTRYKTFWAMVIAEKLPKKKDGKPVAHSGTPERGESMGLLQIRSERSKILSASICADKRASWRFSLRSIFKMVAPNTMSPCPDLARALQLSHGRADSGREA